MTEQHLGPVVISCTYCDMLIPVPVWAILDADEIDFQTDQSEYEAHLLRHEVGLI